MDAETGRVGHVGHVLWDLISRLVDSGPEVFTPGLSRSYRQDLFHIQVWTCRNMIFCLCHVFLASLAPPLFLSLPCIRSFSSLLSAQLQTNLKQTDQQTCVAQGKHTTSVPLSPSVFI